MKAKIYYYVECTREGFRINWLDVFGNKHADTILSEGRKIDAGDVSQEFKIAHPGAVYIETDKFAVLWSKYTLEKSEIASWNAGKPL